ncbi:MAG: phosphomevalonate kinase [Cyphobasidiales sp. Tagirdzhanova-0007]|nr:MAG: phosphomevalonate kinase [Cyphobasidiales sp. Tagirdzhanova-0007]
MPTTVVSAPGKVLIAGGYLVLEPAYSGLVVGTSSRFYSIVRDADNTTSSSQIEDNSHKTLINVRSPQFLDAEWTYLIELEDAVLHLRQVKSSGLLNKFVHLALEAALKVALASGYPAKHDLDIVIAGDNDFYSQGRVNSPNGNNEAEPFTFLDTTLRDVHKTGLGSSAAMVTSLITGVFLHLQGHTSAFSSSSFLALPETDTLNLMHNTAQYAHSQAQGKVGSGFDVAAAIWGSQTYTRFNPHCLSPLLERNHITSKDLLAGLSASSPGWADHLSREIVAFSLPPLTSLLLADVDVGSDTPSMVGRVLKWRKEKPEESDTLWKRIEESNSRLSTNFEKLREASGSNRPMYEVVVSRLSAMPSSQWKPDSFVGSCFCDVRDSITAIRSSMKAMGGSAMVPIEPDEQTHLLDASTEQCPGVLGGGVPGAGGYDAIWVLVLSPMSEPQPEQEVQALWRFWPEMSVRPLSSKARIQGKFLQDIKAPSGLQLHQLKDIPGLDRLLQENYH